MTPAEAYRVLLARRDVVLPVTGLRVRLAPPTMRVLVDAGLALAAMVPQTRKPTEAEAERAAKEFQENARRLLCAAAEEPVFRRRPGNGQYDVDLLPPEDLLFVYTHLIDWGASIFYGTHRADLRPETDRDWIASQRKAAGLVDTVARRYGVLPTQVETLAPVEFSRCLAYLEAGADLEAAAVRKAQSKTRGRRGR